jgi:sugar lactone lactonase YvrE
MKKLILGSWPILWGILACCLFLAAGCGGGGGGGDGSPAAVSVAGTLTGTVTSDGILTAASGVSAAVQKQTLAGNTGIPNAEVWLESDPDRVFRTDAAGKFTITEVPFGVALRVISRYRDPGTGALYVTRSESIAVSRENPAQELGGVALQRGRHPISGRLRDLDGKVVSGAQLSIWGMKFLTNTDGNFTSPEMPESVGNAEVIISATGYRTAVYTLPFYASDLPPFYEIVLAGAGEANIPPVIYLASSSEVFQPQSEMEVQAYISDPDEIDPYTGLKPIWTTTGGSIVPTGDPFVVTWKTPMTEGLATISASFTDSRGGSGRVDRAYAIGGDKTEVMQITSWSPIFGVPGTVVTFSGSGFGAKRSDSRVSFNGLDATILGWTDTAIQVTVPAKVTSGLVVLYSGLRERTVGTFTVSDPNLTLSPVYGPPGTLVTVGGYDFGQTQEDSTLAIGGTLLEVQSWSDTTVTAKIPANAVAGAVILNVRARERTVGAFSVSRSLSTTPTMGTLGTRMIIVGEGFGSAQNAGTIFFNGGVQATAATWSETRITANVPAGAKSGPVTTKIQGADFTLGNIDLCMLSSLTPDRSLPLAETTILGSGFGAVQAAGSVRINGATATIQLWSDTKIVAQVPASATPGLLKVTNNAGNQSSGIYYQVTWVEAIDLARVHAGSVLKFTGYGFGSVLGNAYFGTTLADDYLTWTDRVVEAIVPNGPAGVTTVKLLCDGVTSNEKSVIVAVTEGADPMDGWVGREITITGTHYGTSSTGHRVKLNGQETPIVSWADTAIKVRVPVGAASGPLVLEFASATVELGDFEVRIADSFTQAAKWSGARTKSSPIVHGVVINSVGETFVSDYDNDWIWKYDASGNFVARFGSNGTGPNQFKGPRGMALDASDNIYIADANNNRIQKMDSAGVFQGWYGMDTGAVAGWHAAGSADLPQSGAGAANGQFYEPSDVAIDSTGNVLVIDTLNSRVQKLANDGTFAWTKGANGTGDVAAAPEFDEPRGIHVDAAGKLYVADTKNHRIVLLAADGTLEKWVGMANDDSKGAFGPASGKTGKLGDGTGALYQPYDVALDSSGQLVISDSGNTRLQIIKTDGTFVKVVSREGFAPGQFKLPSTLMVKGEVFYVADAQNARAQKINAAEENLGVIAPDTTGLGTLHFRVAIDSARGIVYVVDEDDHSVSKFSPTGTYLGKLGSQGIGNGQFSVPRGVALDKDGNVYVLDSGNARVQKFDPSGIFLMKFGTFGTGNGQLRAPDQVAVNADGTIIFVGDTENSRVQKFDGSGNFISKWGSAGTADSQFNTISGLAVDSASQTVYVVDRNNHRVQKFDFNGNLIGWFGCDDGDFVGWHGPATNKTGKLGNTLDGQFDQPIDVAVDSEGSVYVTTFNNQDMQKFGQDQSAGASGNYRGTIYATAGFGGIGIDAAGNLYLTNDNNEIEKYTPD